METITRMTYLGPVFMFGGSVRDQEERVNSIKGVFQAVIIIIIGLADRGPRIGLGFQLLRTASNEDQILGWKTREKMFDGSAADTSRGRKDCNGVGRHVGGVWMWKME